MPQPTTSSKAARWGHTDAGAKTPGLLPSLTLVLSPVDWVCGCSYGRQEGEGRLGASMGSRMDPNRCNLALSHHTPVYPELQHHP